MKTSSEPIYQAPEESKGQKRLYRTRSGRLVLRALIRPRVSRVAGHILNSKISRRYIPRFVKKNHILIHEAEEREYRSFNDFFTRTLKDGMRPIEHTPKALISPCDSRLSIFPIDENSIFHIKDSHYTVSSLFDDETIKKEYEGGTCAIFRLTVSDYHRYCYFDSGTKEQNLFIPGKLHTVNPISIDRYPIYKTNCREYTRLHTDHFGDVMQMEVGAMLVGKIINYHHQYRFFRGEEKGRFEFGGSTIVLLFRKGAVKFDEELYDYSKNGLERKVKMGEKIGETP